MMGEFLDAFLIRAFLGGIGVAIVAGPLGCFIVWRRMAYFGDTLAHSALLGVALGLALSIAPTLGAIGVCLLIALLLLLLQRQSHLGNDTLLGILAHSALSLGLVALAFMPNQRFDLMGYLFGDLLAVTWYDIYGIYIGGGFIILILWWQWRAFLALAVHEELARVEGIAVERSQLWLVMLIALVVGVAMKIVGILLITSMLLIPAATAHYFAKTPEQMAWLASLIGCIAVGMGLAMSLWGDTPTGPSIVVSASSLFIMSLLLKAL